MWGGDDLEQEWTRETTTNLAEEHEYKWKMGNTQHIKRESKERKKIREENSL